MCQRRVCTGLEQHVHDSGISCSAGLEEWSYSVLICFVRLGPGGEEGLRHLHIGSVCRPQQGRRTIIVCKIHIGMRRNQFADSCEVATFGSFSHCAVIGSCKNESSKCRRRNSDDNPKHAISSPDPL